MRGSTVLRGFDNGLREHLQQALFEAGMAIVPSCTVTGLTRHADGSIQAKLSDGSSAAFDAVLRATGRQPKTREMNLAPVGVATNQSGAKTGRAQCRERGCPAGKDTGGAGHKK